jgi:Phosphoesterase family
MAMEHRSIMRGGHCLLVAVAALVCFGCSSVDSASRVYPTVAGGCACSVAPPATGWFERVLIIVLENQDYGKAITDPYLGELARQGANFSNFHGLFHPSYSNYLAMVAGKDIPTIFDQQRNLNECTIADLLKSKGLTWKNYAQGYPTQIAAATAPEQCSKDDFAGKYARKHVPFMSFLPIQQHQCDNIVGAGQFDDDLNNHTRPAYAFYTPDLDNDGHDTGLSYAAAWLKGFLEPLRQNPSFMKGTLIVVTFDESGTQSRAAGNHIYTVFLGPMVQPQEIKDNYNHYNVLRTIEDNFGLCPLGAGDGGAKPITSIWK